MEFYKKYSLSIQNVFEQCAERIILYPEPYNKIGQDLLDKSNPEITGKGNYICFLLPFWLQRPFDIDETTTQQLAVANIFKMLCASIQDKAMDSKDPSQYLPLIPLANLFFIGFYSIYQRLFPVDSKLWVYFNQYFGDYAISIDFEKNCPKNMDINLTNADLSILAKKSAPLKLTGCAVCLLSDNEEYIATLVQQLDYVLITLQLVDDWTDKYKDMEDDCFTYVLGEIMQFSQINDFQQLEKNDINKAAYFSDIPNKIKNIALDHQDLLLSLSTVEIPEVINFHDFLITEVNNIIDNISKKKKEILQGGFYNILPAK